MAIRYDWDVTHGGEGLLDLMIWDETHGDSVRFRPAIWVGCSQSINSPTFRVPGNNARCPDLIHPGT